MEFDIENLKPVDQYLWFSPNEGNLGLMSQKFVVAQIALSIIPVSKSKGGKMVSNECIKSALHLIIKLFVAH